MSKYEVKVIYSDTETGHEETEVLYLGRGFHKSVGIFLDQLHRRAREALAQELFGYVPVDLTEYRALLEDEADRRGEIQFLWGLDDPAQFVQFTWRRL